MDKLNIVVYRYRNNTYVKDAELKLKLAEYKSTRDISTELPWRIL